MSDTVTLISHLDGVAPGTLNLTLIITLAVANKVNAAVSRDPPVLCLIEGIMTLLNDLLTLD